MRRRPRSAGRGSPRRCAARTRAGGERSGADGVDRLSGCGWKWSWPIDDQVADGLQEALGLGVIFASRSRLGLASTNMVIEGPGVREDHPRLSCA